MKGSAESVAGHSRLPRTARGSPGAARADPTRITTPIKVIVVVRAALIQHLRKVDEANAVPRLRRASLIGAPTAPIVQPPGQLGLKPAARRSVIMPPPERLWQVLLAHARIGRIVR